MDEYIFGANILENLTTGMYKDSKVIFREYIQNACDQIDKAVEQGILSSIDDGRIEIWLDEDKRTISIEDNATGIPKENFRKTLADIADSSKKVGEDKGFRGIGRLCGLAYCRELIFTSTAIGENVISVMRCDAKKMRELLSRNINGERFTASEVLSQIYEFEYITDDTITSEHKFKVELIGVNEENTELLNFAEVKDYLSFVAPVKYQNTFIYQSEIYAHTKKIGYRIDEYSICLNGEDIFKKYSTKFRTSKGEDDISGVEFKDFYDDDGNLIMWLWVGVSQFKGIIEKGNKNDKNDTAVKGGKMRGIRLRKENIQIGNEDALQKLFIEDRGQHYYIGELFAVSKDLIPNSQRDYFNENEMRVKFESKVSHYFKELKKIYYNASNLRNALINAEKPEKLKSEHQKKEYIDEIEKSKAIDEIKKAENKAEEANKKIDNLKKQAVENTEFGSMWSKVAHGIEKGHNSGKNINTSQVPAPVFTSTDLSDDTTIQKKSSYRLDKLSQLNEKEKEIVKRICRIIKDNTDDKTAEIIISKIEEEYK
ncbi:MAG: ATP-binding protein [Ruminococcus sp.]|nr:ATP-binding protein [Ruminococcus sp.]